MPVIIISEYNQTYHTNLRHLHRSKKNHRKMMVIGQIIGSGQINSFMCIEGLVILPLMGQPQPHPIFNR